MGTIFAVNTAENDFPVSHLNGKCDQQPNRRPDLRRWQAYAGSMRHEFALPQFLEKPRCRLIDIFGNQERRQDRNVGQPGVHQLPKGLRVSYIKSMKKISAFQNEFRIPISGSVEPQKFLQIQMPRYSLPANHANFISMGKFCRSRQPLVFAAYEAGA
jgi:hypothetical protein